MTPRTHRATRLLLASVATLTLPLTPARAADISWSSPTSGRWLDPSKWTPSSVPTSADSATISSPGSYTVSVDDYMSVGSLTLNSPSATLSITNPIDPYATLRSTSFTLSAGTLSIHSNGNSLHVQTGPFTNSGTVTFDADSISSVGPIVIFSTGTGPFTNTGTIEAHQSPNPQLLAVYNLAGSIFPVNTFTNTGTLRTVGSSKLFLSSYTFNQNAGTLDGDVELYGGTFNYNAGSCSSSHPVSLSNSTLNISPSATSGNLFLYTNATLNSDIPAGNTVSTSCYAAVHWNAPSSTVTNAGHLLIGYYNYGQYSFSSSGGPTTPASLQLPSSSTTLLNTGTLEINNPAYPVASLTGSITNQGAVSINAPSTAAPTIVAGSFTQSAGSLTIAPSTSLSLSNSNFYYNGGSITGNISLTNSTLHFAPALTSATGAFTLTSSSSTTPLDGNIPTGVTVSLTASSSTLTLSPFTNAGTLSFNASANSTLTIPGTLTNTGTLSIPSGATLTLAGSLSTSTPLTLQGTLDLHGSLTLTNITSFPINTLRSLLATHHLIDSAASSTQSLAYTPLDSRDPTGPWSLSLSLTGDINLDGKVNADDYALLDRSYAQHLANAHWSNGDFNYDGIINQNDYLLIDRSLYQAQGFSPGFLTQRESQFGSTYITELLTSLPEPSPLAACGLALPLCLSRPTRRRTPKTL